MDQNRIEPAFGDVEGEVMSKFFIVKVTSVLSKEYCVEAESRELAEKRADDLGLHDELETYDWVERETKSDIETDDPAEFGNTVEVIRADE